MLRETPIRDPNDRGTFAGPCGTPCGTLRDPIWDERDLPRDTLEHVWDIVWSCCFFRAIECQVLVVAIGRSPLKSHCRQQTAGKSKIDQIPKLGGHLADSKEKGPHYRGSIDALP